MALYSMGFDLHVMAHWVVYGLLNTLDIQCYFAFIDEPFRSNISSIFSA